MFILATGEVRIPPPLVRTVAPVITPTANVSVVVPTADEFSSTYISVVLSRGPGVMADETPS